jgi:spermidine synthase
LYRIIFAFFFLSGFSSLVFEILWERMLATVFGHSSFALSTLLTAFMGGMALGSWLAGKYADRFDRPLRLYGALEGGIGLYAFIVPFALDYLPTIYGAMFDHFLNDFYLFSLLRFAAAFAILILPTTMMGATLPIVSQWISKRQRLFQGSIGVLYGINTVGACIGALLAGFFLLPTLGLSATNTTFAFVNLGLCTVVILTDHFLGDKLEPSASIGADDDLDDEEIDELQREAAGVTRTADPIPHWLGMVVLGAFALSGAISMSYQVLLRRAYVIILGSSTYSFTLILVAFLIGLGVGSSVMSPFVKRIRRPVFWLSLVQFGVAASATIAFFTLDHLPQWLFHYFQDGVQNVSAVYLYYFFLVGLVVLIPTFLQGMTFPLVIRSVVHDRETSGEKVGNAYAFNTAGSIVGSFASGFILLVSFGLYASMSIVVGINLLLALVLGVLELRERGGTRRIGALAAALLVAGAAFLFAPPIDRVELTRGMFRAYWAQELYTEEHFEEDDPELAYYEDGLTATVSVEKRENLTTLKSNGKPEASDGDDMSTQILVGLLPYAVRSAFEDVPLGGEDSAMIGYGSGVTAGAALQWPLDSLECVEIEPAMVEASRHFNHVNHKPLQDDRLEIIESDGRNYLEYTDKKYDVIVSEPSNPWIAGVASLFTVDHFEAVKSHMKEDAVFAQWVQLYEMRPENVRTIINTFTQVFPHVHGFTSKPKGTDLILLASKRPLPFPPEGYRRAFSVDSAEQELKRGGLDNPFSLYGLAFMSKRELEEFGAGAPLNTDDNGLLEFAAPKDLILYEEGEEFFVDKFFEESMYGDLRPYLEDWPSSDEWTPERVGKLARAEWLAGKPKMADAVMEDAGLGSFEQAPEPFEAPFDALESTLLVRHAQQLDLDDGLLQAWPVRQSKWHELLVEAIADDKRTQTMHYLEGKETPDADGYSGERGLLYAYLLYETKYYAYAERQIDRLEDEDDPLIVTSLAYRLLRGAIKFKRTHYEDAWEAYLEAGKTRL